MEETQQKTLNLGKLAPGAGVLGLVGTLACWGMMFSGNDKMWGSFMFGWYFWMSITIGMFGITILHHAVRGQWSLAILRLLEAGSGWKTFALMGALLSPVIIQPIHLYEWADRAFTMADPVLRRKEWFLNQPGWTIRVIAVLVLFAALSAFFRHSTVRQDKNLNFKLEAGRSSWAGVSLVFFFLASTLFVTDLVMSMEPHWSSTMYGPWQIIAGGGAALAFCLLLQCTEAGKKPFSDILRPQLTRDQGNMMFALTMFWGYTTISQFLIIWNGNIPETTAYFAKRSSAMYPQGMEGNHWGILGLLLIIGRFFIPFFLLIAPRSKTKVMNLAKITGWILVMHFFDMYMLVIPAVHGRAEMGPLSGQIFFDILACFSVGCLWLATFAHQTKQAPLFPVYDTRLQEAKAHAH